MSAAHPSGNSGPRRSGLDLPLATAQLPGTGGAVGGVDDFFVEEIPAYAPCGEGEHCMVLIEKRGLTTPAAIRQICQALGLDPARAGYAGLKDRHAVTRQWISLGGALPAQVRQFQGEGLQVLHAELHRNKLRTGHLRGNRFRVVLRGAVPDGLQRAQSVLAQLTAEGLPNYFGEQRFGREGDNAERGLRLLRGELTVRDRTVRRLLVSALQSALFNEVLAERVQQGSLRRLLGGEVLQRAGSSSLFVSTPDSRDEDARRLAAGEVVITGPICGPRMPGCAPGSPAAELEQAVFDRTGVAPQDFAALGRIARGGRRPLTVPVEDATVSPTPDGTGGLVLGFVLPPGAYATVLLGEVSKNTGVPPE